jgi:hypothetical protein
MQVAISRNALALGNVRDAIRKTKSTFRAGASTVARAGRIAVGRRVSLDLSNA